MTVSMVMLLLILGWKASSNAEAKGDDINGTWW